MAIPVKSSGANFTPAPEGVHQAVCCDVVPEYGVTRKKPDGTEYKRDEITIIYQLNARNPENSDKPFQVRRVFGMSLHDKSALRPFLESWRGKKFTKEELSDGFDVEKLIGVNCNLQILHNGDWANIAGIMPLGAGQPRIEITDYTRKQTEPLPAQAEAVAAASVAVAQAAAVPDDIPF